MRADYELTLADVETYHVRQATWRSAELRAQAAVAAVATGLLAGLSALRDFGSLASALAGFTAGAVAGFLVFPVYFRWRVRRNVRIVFGGAEGRKVLGKRTFETTDSGLAEWNDRVRTEVPWAAFDAAIETDEHVLLRSGPSVGFPFRKAELGRDGIAELRSRLGDRWRVEP